MDIKLAYERFEREEGLHDSWDVGQRIIATSDLPDNEMARNRQVQYILNQVDAYVASTYLE